MKITAQIYRLIVPKFIRKKILAKNLKEAIFRYFTVFPELVTNEIQQVLNYLKGNPIAIFPYPFQKKYRPEDIEVLFDSTKGLHYVMLDGKRLYFKKRWGIKRIQHSFNELTREQDPESPHRYLTEQFKIEEGEVLVDIGVAEGNFALGAIEKASGLILFETDKEWIEALNATFEPWKEKVFFIEKYLSDEAGSSTISLDSILVPESGSNYFIKLDIEGFEQKALSGMKKLIASGNPIKMNVCIYHHPEDRREIEATLVSNGFSCEVSDGYLIYFQRKEEPAFRKALIRARKPAFL